MEAIAHIYLSIYTIKTKQLKTFLTQFESALPLALDPLIRLQDDKKVQQPWKSQFGGHFCQNRIFTNVAHTRPSYPFLWTHPRIARLSAPHGSHLVSAMEVEKGTAREEELTPHCRNRLSSHLQLVRLAGCWWLVLICSERKVLLAGC
jgi:hypothetical protein